MEKMIGVAAMTLALLTAGSIPAFCAAGAQLPRTANVSIGHVQVEAVTPQPVLAQAGTEAVGGGRDMNSLVADGLLVPATETKDSQLNDKNEHLKDSASAKNSASDGPQRCKNGKSVGNKHCVPSPSE